MTAPADHGAGAAGRVAHSARPEPAAPAARGAARTRAGRGTRKADSRARSTPPYHSGDGAAAGDAAADVGRT